MIAETAIAKIGGIIAGTILALVFLPPHGWKEFFQRVFFSILFGAILSGALRRYLAWPDDAESSLQAATLAAGGAWWIAGAALRISGSISSDKLGSGTPKPKDNNDAIPK